VKQRTFFHFSYEGLRLREPATATGNFYTPEARAAVAPVYRPVVDALPVPNGPLVNPACDNVAIPCLRSLTVSYSNPTSLDASSVRLDQTLRAGQTMFVRVSHAPSTSVSRLFASTATSRRNADLITGGWTSTVGSSLLNDLRLGWSRATGLVELGVEDAYGAAPPPVSALFPQSSSPSANLVSILFPQGTVGMGTRLSNRVRQINVVDTVSLVREAHQIKFGIDYRHLQPASMSRGGYFLVLSDFSQLRAGTMGTAIARGAEPITLSVHNLSVFAQDSWSAGPRLTLTYGFRWELNTAPVSVTPDKPLYAIEGIFDEKPLQFAPPGTPLWRTRSNNLAPRVGGTYQLTPSTIVRGGFGVYSDLGYGRLLGSLIFGFPYDRLRATPVAGQPFDLSHPAFAPPPLSTAIADATDGQLAAFDPNLQLPLTLQWNVAVERDLGARQSLIVTYLGAEGRRLLRPDFVVPPEARRLGLVSISATRNAGRSTYDALEVQYQRRLQRGLQALASYTLAKASDLESDDGGGNFFGIILNANSATSLSGIELPALAPADFDVRHAFAAALSYELPAPAWGNVAHTILKDWGIDAIVRSSSPRPLNVRITGVSPELGTYHTQPDLVPGQPIWLAAPAEPGGKVLNPDAFTLPPEGRLGNFPRNSIRSPFFINQTDLALRRRFPVAGAASLEFRAELFNLFNYPMFGGTWAPSTNWGRCTTRPCTGQQSPSFGKVQPGTTLNVGLGGDPIEGGQNAIYAVGGSRSIQFSLKLRF
jgi:hypothetical protein